MAQSPYYVLALDSSAHWTVNSSGTAVVTYSFDALEFNVPEAADSIENPRTLNLAMRGAARQAFAAIAAVTNIRFVDLTGSSQTESAQIKFTSATISGGDVAGFAYYPDPIYGTDVVIDSYYETQNLAPGTDGFHTFIHEIGHAVGLKHPFAEQGDPPYTLPAAEENYDATMMSYSDGINASGGTSMFPKSPMIYDIATLQAIYGKNTTTHAGNSVHTLGTPGASTLWDAGGVDRLDASSLTTPVTINLNEGYNKVTKAGSQRLWLAFGSSIENATGGAGADSLIGNGLANRLDGSAGNDTLTGDAGIDSLVGGTGADFMSGGTGNDFYYVDNSGDRVSETSTLASEIDRVNSSISFSLGPNLEQLVLTGTAAINATGNSLANALFGNSASNTLNGGAGADSMSGGTGNDIYYVDNSGDRVTETSALASEIDRVNSSISFSLGPNLEQLVLTGTAAINASGNSLANALYGNSASNTLNGGAGSDTLSGGSGTDVLAGFSSSYSSGSKEIDFLTGGSDADRFLLGSSTMRFYDDGSTTTTGLAGYALITDFTPGQDRLQLDGTSGEYSLRPSGIIGLSGIGLWHEQGPTDELIAVIRSANTTSLSAANTINTALFV